MEKYLFKITLTNGETLTTQEGKSLGEVRNLYTWDLAEMKLNNRNYLINPNHIIYLTHKELEE